MIEHENSEKNVSDTKIHYAVLQSELTGDLPHELEENEKIKYSKNIEQLSKDIDTMEIEVENVRKEHKERMDKAKKQYSTVLNKLQRITQMLIKTDDFT